MRIHRKGIKMRTIFYSLLAITICFNIFEVSHAQNFQVTPVDTIGSVGTDIRLRLDKDGNPYIFYYDWTHNRTKFAYRQDAVWHVEDSFQRDGFDDFKIDSLGNIHCSFARQQTLEYGLIENNSLQITVIDSGQFYDYRDSRIELIDGVPHIVGIQYLPAQLVEAYPQYGVWKVDTLCSLPTYPSSLEFKIQTGVKHAIVVGTWDENLAHYEWTIGTPIIEFARQDSTYYVTAMDLDRDGNPWVIYTAIFDNGFPAFVTHKTGSYWRSELIDTTFNGGAGGSPRIGYYYAGDLFYILFERGGYSYGSLLLAHKADNYWIYDELYQGTILDYNMAFDNEGNLHVAFNLLNPGNDYNLYYGFLASPLGLDEARNNEPVLFSLSAYPNPFNSATTITLTGAEQAEIGIYDITGRLITTLHAVGGQALWDASAYSSGLYFARAAAEKASTIKLVLVK
jgi:hypothetical protein